MTQLNRFLLKHALIGGAVGMMFVATLLALDVANLASLMGRSPSGILAAVILAFATGLTFGSVQMGFAVMLMTDDSGPRAGRRAPVARLIPNAVRVRADHRN
jgi:hypothetical protein